MEIDNEKWGARPVATGRNNAPARGSQFVVESGLPPSPLRRYGGRDFSPTLAFSGGGRLDGLSHTPSLKAAEGQAGSTLQLRRFSVFLCKRPVGDLTRLNQIKVKPASIL